MGNLTILVGRSASGKTSEMLERIRDYDPKKRHIILTPDQLSHKLERELCRICGDEISARGEVVTFSRLCNYVFTCAGGGNEPELDKGGRMILLHRAVSQSAGKMKVLQNYAKHSSFFEKLMTTVDELKNNLVETESLLELDEVLREQDKIQDIALICSFYDSYTKGLGENQRKNIENILEIPGEALDHAPIAFDFRDRLTRMADALADCYWGEDKVFWVDGFTDFTPQQREVLRHLLQQGSEMTLCLTGDLSHMGDETSIFLPALQTIQQCQDMAKREFATCTIQEIAGDFSPRNSVLSHMEQEIFQDEPAVWEGELEDALHLYAGQHPLEEVEWVAREIRNLVQFHQYRYGDILVLSRDFNKYRPFVETCFPRYDIPFFASEMTNILEKPVISLINTAFQVINSGFDTEIMMEYLKTGLTNVSDKQVHQVENYLILWKDTVWLKKWTRHSSRYDGNVSQEMLRRLKEENHPDFPYKVAQYKKNQSQLNKLNKIRLLALKPLLDLMKACQSANGKTQCEAVYQFLQDLDMAGSIFLRRDALSEAGDLAQSLEYKQLWEVVCTALERSHQIFSHEIMEFSEFSKVFTLVLSKYSVGTIPVSLDQVTAGETVRLKSHRRKVVFWMGCDDTTVPKVSSSGGILSDYDRILLRKWNISLNQTEEQLLYREMTTAYEICALPTERLYFTYATRSMAGESMRPCFLLDRVQKAYPQLEIQVDSAHSPLLSPWNALEMANKYPFVLDSLEKWESPRFSQGVESWKKMKEWKRGALSHRGVQAIYGKGLTMSATAMDTLASCPFSFFFHYGLGVRALEPLSFGAAEYGNLLHFIMEEGLKDLAYVVKTEEKEEIIQNITESHIYSLIDSYVAEQLGGKENKSARELFLQERVYGYLWWVFQEVCEEIRRSKFTYLGGEVKFKLPVKSICGDYPEKIPLQFQGSIDRIDGFYREVLRKDSELREEKNPMVDIENTLYLHLVDYKSGTKEVAYGNLLHGRDLQLLLYYLAVKSQGSGIFGRMWQEKQENPPPIRGIALSYLLGKTEIKSKSTKENKTKGPSPRGNVCHKGIYVHHDPMLAVLESADYYERKKHHYRYSPMKSTETYEFVGVEDAMLEEEDFQRYLQLAKGHLTKVSDFLSSGNVDASPYYYQERDNACQYCRYTLACHYNPGVQGDEMRILQKMKSEQVLAYLAEEGETEGNDDGIE